MTTETPERWRQIAALFDEAVKLAPEHRGEYLDSACGGDADLRRSVVELLEASGEAADFLERPLVSRPAEVLGRMAEVPEPGPAPPSEDPRQPAPTQTLASSGTLSRTLGPYVLSQKIGEGGMGEVYLAEQREPVRRKVALKVIKAGMDTKQVVARFEAERQALALMDHPAIAKVFDAGETPDHRPYFIMEYVTGVPITEHCDRQTLTTRQRLELFIQVCDGVQHAHQKAVIHRDLKPSNVLVTFQDGRAVAKIIDFGVAKALSQRLTERTLFTELGLMIGTPEYMSPEQAEMTGQDVDTRTDVYSLGVMLYELLTGTLPFDPKTFRSAGLEEIRRKIRKEEPPRPSTRLLTLGRAQTMESARNRRVDVPTFRRQLRGDLDWITMRALEKDRTRRYGSPSELAADLRRHLEHEPVLAGPPSTIYRAGKFVRRHAFGVAVSAVAVVTLIVVTATLALQARRISRERDRAERVSEFLVNLFEVSDPAKAQGNTITAREVLDRGAASIASGLVAEPQVRAQLIHTLGRVYMALGVYPKAEQLLVQAVDIRKRALGPENPETLKSTSDLVYLYVLEGRLPEAERLGRETLDLDSRVLGAEHPDTLRSMSNLASTYMQQGRLPEAETLQEKGVEVSTRVLGPEHPDTLRYEGILAHVYSNHGRHQEAEKLYQGLFGIRKRVLGPEHPDTLSSAQALAHEHTRLGRYHEAEMLHQETLEIRRRVLGPEHPSTLMSMDGLAAVYSYEGRHDEAEKLYREALEIERRVLGPEHPDTLTCMLDLALAYSNRGEYQQAEQLYRSTLDIQRRVLGAQHPNTAIIQYNLACVAARRGQRDKALDWLREAVVNGFHETDAMAKDADLASLRDDPEFKRLLAVARESTKR